MISRIRNWLADRIRATETIPLPLPGAPGDGEVSTALAGAMLADLIRERRAERRWRVVKRTGFSLFFVSGILFYVYFYLAASGAANPFERQPAAGSIGVVRISGPIASDRPASAENLIPQLRRAFESDRIRAVALQIDSPGGAPVESERINAFLSEIRTKHPKPLYAVIENVGASAAYMIAVHADEIYAGRYSLVGSVGAMLGGWDVHRALQRFDVERRMFASGELKTMLDPFLAPTEQADEKAQSMVSAIGAMFVAEVRHARGSRLNDSASIASGEVWNGDEALALGLIDGIGTLESLQAKLDGAPIRVYERRSPLGIAQAFSSWSAAVGRGAVDAVLERRFALD